MPQNFNELVKYPRVGLKSWAFIHKEQQMDLIQDKQKDDHGVNIAINWDIKNTRAGICTENQ